MLVAAVLLALRGESLAEHDGAAGTRDEGMLDSAPARPLNLAAYGQPTVAERAASYGVGVAMRAGAAGEVTGAQFADWIGQHIQPR